MRIIGTGLLAVLSLIRAVLFRQTSGSVEGEIRDSSCGIIGGAALTFTDEATNATPQISSNALPSSTFGAISSTAPPMRQLQFGLKYVS
jgi:hypothetical protein